MDIPSALVFSTQPPVSVYGTGGIILTAEAFLGNMVTSTITSPGGSVYFQVRVTPTPLNALIRQCAGLSLFRHFFENNAGAGMLTSCPSISPFGLTLGPD